MAQCEKLKSITSEECLKELCIKCGKFLHSSANYEMCYGCYKYGHINKDYQNKKKGKIVNLFSNLIECMNNLKEITMLIDSYASHHLTGDGKFLFDFVNFIEPKPVSTAVVECDTSYSSLGQGKLTILFQFETDFTETILEIVQFIPQISDTIISCYTFNKQYSILFILDTNIGYIYSRKINQTISLLKIKNIYQTVVYALNQRFDILYNNNNLNNNYDNLYCRINSSYITMSQNKDILCSKITRRNKARRTKLNLLNN